MLFRCRSCFSLFILAIAIGTYSCANSQTPGDASATPAPEAGAQSSADEVGSVPEDMLADERGVEGEVADGTQADPFSDLTENADQQSESTAEATDAAPADGDTSSTEAMAVAEENNDASTSSDSAASGQTDHYQVKAGDTLMKIAFHLYGDVDRWKDLHELNRGSLKNGNLLRKGMKLRYEVPLEAFQPDQASHSYEIKKGDTLAQIADEVYGRQAKYKKLQGFNKHLIKNPNRIFAGFTIYYDITEKEIAEAEARRAERQAQAVKKEEQQSLPSEVKEGAAESAAAPASSEVPSAVNPPAETAPAEKRVASTPSASDSSAEPGPQSSGPPAPAESSAQ